MKNPVIHITLQVEPEQQEAEICLFKQVVSALNSAAFGDRNARITMPGMDLTLRGICSVNASWPNGSTVVIRVETGSPVVAS
jgi:hypothetical protein